MVIRVNDLIPFFQGAQFFSAVTQHLVQCAVREYRATFDIEEADTDLGILENGTEELLARLRAVLHTVAHGSSLQ
jgi:hypothetical protein